MTDADTERRSRLLAIMLRAVVREHLNDASVDQAETLVFALGAAISHNNFVWVFVDGDAERSLGPVIAWANINAPGQEINLLAKNSTPILARRAQWFVPQITVWHVDEQSITQAVAAPHVPVAEAPVDHLALAPRITESGAQLVVEHGVVCGEIMGLEICRVVNSAMDGEATVEVGMGAHDREAFAMVHGHLPTSEAMQQVVDAVARYRAPGNDPHPFNRFGAERLFRWQALQDPAAIGCRSLQPGEPAVPRTNVKDPVPCIATGVSQDGERVVACFMTGVDLDVVPFAIDAAHRLGSESVMVVLRSRDVMRSIKVMADVSTFPVRIVAFDPA
jgi:hypothetical protein